MRIKTSSSSWRLFSSNRLMQKMRLPINRKWNLSLPQSENAWLINPFKNHIPMSPNCSRQSAVSWSWFWNKPQRNSKHPHRFGGGALRYEQPQQNRICKITGILWTFCNYFDTILTIFFEYDTISMELNNEGNTQKQCVPELLYWIDFCLTGD